MDGWLDVEAKNLIQGQVFTGEGESEGQRLFLLLTDVLLLHEVLQRL